MLKSNHQKDHRATTPTWHLNNANHLKMKDMQQLIFVAQSKRDVDVLIKKRQGTAHELKKIKYNDVLGGSSSLPP
ncbi:hypothetical protein Bca101_049663 [Brassica carinata]